MCGWIAVRIPITIPLIQPASATRPLAFRGNLGVQPAVEPPYDLLMPWNVAHAIMCFHFKSGEQDRFPVCENVLLIEAAA
jgi:hypothetical protein